jgi:hypothetical protein
MADYIFRPPTVEEGPAGGGRLFYFYRLARGITVIKQNDAYSLIRYPLDEDLATYQEYYLGGRNHTVNDSTKAALIAADIGITESNFTAL